MPSSKKGLSIRARRLSYSASIVSSGSPVSIRTPRTLARLPFDGHLPESVDQRALHRDRLVSLR
jgi:hypothetical protein